MTSQQATSIDTAVAHGRRRHNLFLRTSSSSHLSETVVIHFLQDGSLDRVHKSEQDADQKTLVEGYPHALTGTGGLGIGGAGPALAEAKERWTRLVRRDTRRRAFMVKVDCRYTFCWWLWNAIQQMRTANCNRRCQS
jgi:hypothetical protein